MAPEDNDPVLDWPLDRGESGREVWYGLVGPADGSTAFWYRYTLLSTEDGRQEGRLWAALTDGEDDATAFGSRAFALEEVWPEADPFSLAIGDAELTSSSARGAFPAGGDATTGDGTGTTPEPDASGAVPIGEDLAGVPIEWDLEYGPDPYSFTPLRSRRLTDLLAAVAGTGKHWSANEAVRVDGTVRVGDRTVDFDAAPGHQGHTLGSSPPDSWTWMQCNGFPDASVSVEALNLGGTLSLCLRRDGEVHALNRLKHVVGPRANRTEYDETGHWRFAGAGEGVELRATVEADEDHWQRVSYMAPDGSLRYNAHCSVSRVTLTYRVDGGEARTLESSAGRAEWVETTPPVPGEYRPVWE